MSLSTNTTYRVYVEKIGDQNPATFVGDEGEVFYDPSSPTLKLSDGSTPGGVTIAGGGGGGGGSSQWVTTGAGIHTLSNVGIGTTNPQTKLEIDGILGFSTTYLGITVNNIRIGDNTTGANLTSGHSNIFMGIGAGNSTTTGFYNNFFGRKAGYNNTSGSLNNFFGKYAGKDNTGSYNTFFGTEAGRYNTSGSYNSFFGHYAGKFNTEGSNNSIFGAYTGISTSASSKVILGSGWYSSYEFDAPDTTKDTQLAIGVRTDANPANYWIVGNENFNVGIGTTNPTSKLTVQSGDIRVGVDTSQGIILTDANGVAWRLFMNTNGTLGIVAV